jgi:hypothetical protein
MTRTRSRAYAACLAVGLAIVTGSQPATAYYCQNGQLPAPPDLAARMALPLCGFDAAKRWGPNGCQLCDSRNMHPNPFTGEPRRAHRHRAYE